MKKRNNIYKGLIEIAIILLFVVMLILIAKQNKKKRIENIDKNDLYSDISNDELDNNDENDKRSENARELYAYLYNNKEGLIPYRERGIELPELPENMRYGNMGVQENQNCTVITRRMKGNRKRWSIEGANNMAKLLYKKENKELVETINRYEDKLIFDIKIKEVITKMSVAKTPKKDGKGNPYVDVINRHMPLKDAIQTASLRAFLSVMA